MFGHDNVADHVELVATTGLFEKAFEDVLWVGGFKKRLPTIATEGEEVETAGLLVTLQPPRHEVEIKVCSFLCR